MENAILIHKTWEVLYFVHVGIAVLGRPRPLACDAIDDKFARRMLQMEMEEGTLGAGNRKIVFFFSFKNSVFLSFVFLG